MRARKRKHTEQRLRECLEYYIETPENYFEEGALPFPNWDAFFPMHRPFHLEIGCGKGTFICEQAKARPDLNFIAVEKSSDILVLAVEKAKSRGLTNVRFLCRDANDLGALFRPGTFEVIYLNFPDPWHKVRHAKRRLTSESFLALYRTLLSARGRICFKTDNRPLFDYSLDTFSRCGYHLRNICHDLHHSPFAEENIKTEYEINFSAKGFLINRLEAYPGKEEDRHEELYGK